MQPDEVGPMTGFKSIKPVMKQAVAGSTRRGKGSTKEKGYTPMVMGSRPMAKDWLNGKPAVAGKTRVWTSAALWEANISFATKTHYTPHTKHDTPHKKH